MSYWFTYFFLLTYSPRSFWSIYGVSVCMLGNHAACYNLSDSFVALLVLIVVLFQFHSRHTCPCKSGAHWTWRQHEYMFCLQQLRTEDCELRRFCISWRYKKKTFSYISNNPWSGSCTTYMITGNLFIYLFIRNAKLHKIYLLIPEFMGKWHSYFPCEKILLTFLDFYSLFSFFSL